MLSALLLILAGCAQALPGVVVMHGKQGAPGIYVAPLAKFLKKKGLRVINDEMSWSKDRQYDEELAASDEEISAKIAALRKDGADKIFLVGFSMGGAVAVHYGARFAVDGVVAVAPGFFPGSPGVSARFSPHIAKASQAVAAGKGGETMELYDYEAYKGDMPIKTTPDIYLTWFDPSGGLDFAENSASLKSPALYIVPEADSDKGFGRYAKGQFRRVPGHPMNKLIEPKCSHFAAPKKMREEVYAWITAVAGS